MAERVLFVHAHPDDESISTGATIATLIDRGASVTVLTLTRGERGEVIPADLQHLVDAPEQLGSAREAELAEAMRILGVSDHRILGNPDARWQGREPRRYVDSGMSWGKRGAQASGILDPDSLTAADAGEVAADIAAVLIDVEPDVVVSYADDGGYGHPDHVRAHEATRTAAQVIGVPFYVIAPRGRAAVVVNDPAVAQRKAAALAAHRTQVLVQGDTFSLSSGEPRPLGEPERFDRLRPARAFSSMSLPSRIGSSVLGLVIGAFAGSVLTVAHRATVDVLGVTVPWGIIATVVITAALLTGLSLVFESRVVAACAAVGLLGAILLLSLGSAGGSVLVPDDVVGYIFLIAPVVIAGVVLAWPQDGRWRRGKMGIPAAEGPDQK